MEQNFFDIQIVGISIERSEQSSRKQKYNTVQNKPYAGIRFITYVCNEWILTRYFGKILMELCSPNLYASFGTFCVIIGKLFKHSEELQNRQTFQKVDDPIQ